VGQGISELRIDYGPGYRVYFLRRGDEIIILLCGGDKSSQENDIKTAKRLAEEWR
jgi:putative addiction module killer protein